jgi:hypothetical protein
LIYRGKGKVKGKEERNETVPTSAARIPTDAGDRKKR